MRYVIWDNMNEQIKPVDVDEYMLTHGKPVLKKVVSHVRDIDKEMDLSREERIAVLSQAVDKTLQDRYYYTQRKDVQEKQEKKENKLLGTKIEKASKLAEEEQETEEEAEEEPEEEEAEEVEEEPEEEAEEEAEEEEEDEPKTFKSLDDLLQERIQ